MRYLLLFMLFLSACSASPRMPVVSDAKADTTPGNFRVLATFTASNSTEALNIAKGLKELEDKTLALALDLSTQPGARDGVTTGKQAPSSREYCFTVYVARVGGDAYEARASTPVRGDETPGTCHPLKVADALMTVRLSTAHTHFARNPPKRLDYLVPFGSFHYVIVPVGGGTVVFHKIYRDGRTLIRSGGEWRLAGYCLPDRVSGSEYPQCFSKPNGEGRQVSFRADGEWK